jgi:pimeloyl-ACP methyl ester carboxylesterase
VTGTIGVSAPSPTASVPGGPIIVGFYGANAWLGGHNGGNERMVEIGNTILDRGFQQKTFNSLSINSAYNWLLDHLDLNDDGKYDPTNGDQAREIKIYGHSWGGTTAAQLTQRIKNSSSFVAKTVHRLFLIDPVVTLRFTSGWVPDNVLGFQNEYQTKGTGVVILGVPVHGKAFTSYAQITFQTDNNPGNPDNGIDHWDIIDHVRSALLFTTTGQP